MLLQTHQFNLFLLISRHRLSSSLYLSLLTLPVGLILTHTHRMKVVITFSTYERSALIQEITQTNSTQTVWHVTVCQNFPG